MLHFSSHKSLHIFLDLCPPFVLAAQNGAVRLVQNGSSSLNFSTGIVQVYLGSEWGGICFDDVFNKYAADVICHQLGYVSAISFSGSSQNK